MELANLPLEVIEYIGRHLTIWDDVWCFTSIFLKLRKIYRFAVYARRCYRNALTNCIGGTNAQIMNHADDRCRHFPYYFRNGYEHLRVNYTWVNYEDDFYNETMLERTWIYKPYGEYFTNRHVYKNCHDPNFNTKYRRQYTIRALKKNYPQTFYTLKQNIIKERYDNLYKQIIIRKYNKFNKLLISIFGKEDTMLYFGRQIHVNRFITIKYQRRKSKRLKNLKTVNIL